MSEFHFLLEKITDKMPVLKIYEIHNLLLKHQTSFLLYNTHCLSSIWPY